jgi:hypothetical protein
MGEKESICMNMRGRLVQERHQLVLPIQFTGGWHYGRPGDE